MLQNNFQGPQRQQASWQDPSLPPPYSLHPPTTPLEPQSVEEWWNTPPQHQASLPEKTLQHEEYPSENLPLYQENPPGYTPSLGGHPANTSWHGGQNSMKYHQTSNNSSPPERSSHHGSKCVGQRREKHHHRSHKPSRRDKCPFIDASTHGSQRRHKHHNSHRSSQREEPSCQGSETSAPSQDGRYAPSGITEDYGVDDESSAPKATMGEHGLTKGNHYYMPRFADWVEQSPRYTAPNLVRDEPYKVLPSDWNADRAHKDFRRY